MTRSNLLALPSLIELAAKTYAQGRLDGTKPGDRWWAYVIRSRQEAERVA